MMNEGDSPPIDILLCTDKSDTCTLHIA